MDPKTFCTITLFRIQFLLLIIFSIIIYIFFFSIQRRLVTVPAAMISPNEVFPKETILPLSSLRCIVYMRHREGRLGNRMFMIASAYGLARLHACHLCLSTTIIKEMREIFTLDLPPFLLSSSMLQSLINDKSKPMIWIIKNAVCQYMPELTRRNAIPRDSIFELTGFWQSYLYFAKYSSEFREHIFVGAKSVVERVSQFFIHLYQQKFGITPKLSTSVYKILKRQLTKAKETTWIGVHVRRSDFLPVKYASSDEYLFAAIDSFTDQYPKAHFIVASDDKPYCRKLFENRSNIFITPESFSFGDDFIALSLCEHSIVTGGTFGWWSAYLANGRVIHDEVYPSRCERPDHYYPPWFLISNKNITEQNRSWLNNINGTR